VAVEAAAAASPGWSSTPADQRQRLLSAAADLLDERKAEIAATVHDEPPMPFGGVKASGRFGGTAALHEFTELRWITVQEGSRHYPT
jgi:acyl-CoA reductase-like NAD-dependent aldehyde dehydrogenase